MQKTLAFIDAHCHLSDERIFSDASAIISRAEAAGVKQMRIGGVSPKEWLKQIELTNKYPDQIFASFGLHPWWIEKMSREEITESLKILETKIHQASAVGETGLDFFSKRDAGRFADQEFAFRAQLKLALRFQKPVVLHIVQAHDVAIKIIRDEKAETLKFQVHSFSGNAEHAKAWVNLGAFLSFSGGILKNQSHVLLDALAQTPTEQLLFETDAPDQAWVKGRANEPAHVVEIYQKAAQVLNLPLEKLTQIVADNFSRFA